ncbi:MAG: MMPL family transporter [Gammaproteobacteria bacterium]|nr:MMPL family transporter [Gammaproteobacteria bacterium]
MERLSSFLVRYRACMLVVTLLVTAGSAWLASGLKIYDDPNRWPPDDDPSVVLNEELQRKFGGANLVTIMIARKDGESIVQADTLAKIKRITDQLEEVHGVIPYAIRSLSTINSRYLKGTAELLDASILFDNPNRAPETAEELARVRFGIENNAALRGALVSKDWSAAIIQADFRTGLQDVREGLELPVTDPIAIYKEVQRIIGTENDGTHDVTAAGSPILIGWVNSDGLPYILGAFILVVTVIAIVLIFAFRSVTGVLPPLCVGVMASTWAFAFQRIFAGDVLTSSAALIAPFIILAVAASHSVLFIKRFLTDELDEERSVPEGLEQTLIHMTRPLIVVLCTDLMAFVVLSFVPFDNVRVLGQVTAFGLLAIIVIVPTFLVALLSYMPAASIRKAMTYAQVGRKTQRGLIYRTTAVMVRPLIYNPTMQWTVICLTGFVLVISLSIWQSIPLGKDTAIGRFLATEISTGQNNTYAVHNYLTKSWEGNELYEMEQEITRLFGGVYTLAILAKGKNPGDAKTPEALVAMDDLSRHLAEAEQVSAVVGLPFYIKIMNRFLNEDQDEHFRVPTEGRAQMAVNEAIYFLTGGTPGAFDFVVDPEYRNTAIIAFVRDTSPGTVAALIRRANEYVEANWDTEALNVELELAAGNVGIADAFNRSIKKWMVLATLFSALGSFIAAALMLRSVIAPLLLMFPLAIGILIWMFLIHLIGIEFNSNVTAALAIASGVGIDAEVYLLYRFREEFSKDGNFKRALFDAFTLVREPLIFSFTALFTGCLAVSIVPLYVGYVGFSMALILLTTFLFSFFAAPVVWSMLRPGFLTRGLDLEDKGGGPRTKDDRVGAVISDSVSAECA